MKIAQCDLLSGYQAQKGEIDAAIGRVLESGWYILGKEVTAFEEEFAAFCGTNYSLGVASGTDAIELILRSLELPADSLVATVSNTAVATIAAIERSGLKPLMVDIAEDTFNMSPKMLRKILNSACRPKIKAIVAVHLYGHPAEIKEIITIANEFNIPVIEDCAQAHGASVDGRRVGSFGIAGAFSFYPTKNLGAVGDGGAVTVNSAELYQKMSELRQYGWRKRYISDRAGINSRLDELQAAILRCKLPYLEADNNKRIEIAKIYNSILKNCACITPFVKANCGHVYHQYVIKVDKRDSLMCRLAERGIGTAVHYPAAIHQQPAYEKIEIPSALSNTEIVMPKILSLPMYPGLAIDDARTVAESIVELIGK
ncbi:MAG: DegT/DnrJ/EryC1/StrS family aminotransferase [Victivallales bacterium]|nr:DegT/DnrJ/EryC1/StrS family aminotransferase [Victivallales bacterium]